MPGFLSVSPGSQTQWGTFAHFCMGNLLFVLKIVAFDNEIDNEALQHCVKLHEKSKIANIRTLYIT